MTHQRSPSNKIGAALRMIRPVNCVMMGFAVLVGEVAILGGIPSASQLILGFSVSFFLTAAAMIINDIVDLEIDRINEPGRPLPSGSLSMNCALALAAATATAGIIASVPLSLGAVAVAILTFLSSLGYNLYGKKTGLAGNAMVSFCVAVPFLFGGIVVVGGINLTVAVFFLLAFLANLGREVTKGIADMEGDRTKGIRTVALVRGPKSAAAVASAFYIMPVLLTPFPYFFGRLGLPYALVVLAVDAGFLYSSYCILRSQDKRTALQVKTQARYWMMLAMIAFLLGGVMR